MPRTLKQKKTIIDAYMALGLVLINHEGDNASAELCPFCDKEEKFSLTVSGPKMGRWRCWSCESGSSKGGGNLYTFMNLLTQLSLQETTDDDYASLWKKKFIVPSAARLCGVSRSSITGEWLIPTYNSKGSVVNIHRWNESNNTLYGLPTIPIQPWGLQFLPESVINPHTPDELSIRRSRTMVLAEGWGDYLTDEHVFRKMKLRSLHSDSKDFDLLGIPGTKTFKEEWLQYLSGRNVVWLLFDGDHPRENKFRKVVRGGYDGMLRIVRMAKEKLLPVECPEFRIMEWPEDSHDGIDQRDLWMGLYKSRVKIGHPESHFLEFITNRIRIPDDSEINVDSTSATQSSSPGEPEAQQITPVEVTGWNDLLEKLEVEVEGRGKALLMTPSLKDALATMFAVIISTPLDDDPIWLYLNGPPASGKSTLCLCFTPDREYCVAIDRMTGIHSGHKLTKQDRKAAKERGEKPKDASLVDIIRDKTWIIKDWTMFLSSGEGTRNTVGGELRDIYDGETSSRYRQMQGSNHNVRFSMLAGVTDEIYAQSNSHLGERFLIMDVTDKYHGSHDHVRKVMQFKRQALFNSFPVRQKELQQKHNAEQREHEQNGEGESPNQSSQTSRPNDANKRLLPARRAVMGYTRHLKQRMETLEPPELSKETESQLISLARFIAAARSRVRREVQDGSPVYRSRHEIGNRLAGQFQKLAVCLAIVLERDSVDADVMRIITRIARNTAHSFNLDIVECLGKAQQEGATGLDRMSIASRIGIKEQTVLRRLNDLQELKIIDRVRTKAPGGVQGRFQHLWHLLPKYLKLWTAIQEK